MSEPHSTQHRDGGRARGETPRSARRGSLRAGVAVLLLGVHLGGCFHYVPPMQSAPAPGAEITFGVTDRGRVELTPVFGPGLQRVGGRLLESTDTTLVLSVATVDYIDLGITARWAGERVEVRRDLIADVRERRFSAGRTAVAAVMATAVAVAVSLIAIRGFGGDTPPDRPDPGNGQQQ
jgi:hypothetical protein